MSKRVHIDITEPEHRDTFPTIDDLYLDGKTPEELKSLERRIDRSIDELENFRCRVLDAIERKGKET